MPNMTEEVKEKDTAKKVIELKKEYETDKADLETKIKEKDNLVVDLSEQIRQKDKRISTLEKDLEAEQRENRIIRQVELEKKEVKEQKSFLEEYERLKNQSKQTSIK